MSASKFTKRLKELMISHGFTAKILGERTGINYRTIEIWMSAKASIPRADRAVALAKALGVTVEYLITGETANQWKPPPRYADIVEHLESMDDSGIEAVRVLAEGYANRSKTEREREA